MNLGEIVSTIFRKDNQEKVPRNLSNSTALSQSSLYANVDWPQYNPDDLMNRKGFGIYRRMRNDEQIKVVARFRRNATTSREWFFEFDDSVELSDSEKEFRVDLFTEIVKKIKGSYKAKLDGAMTSLYNGFSLTEKLFGMIQYKGKSYIGIKNLRTKPFDTFYFTLDEWGELTKFYQDLEGNVKTLDINKFIHHVHNSDENEYYGQSELRECYRPWFTKDMAYRFRNIWMERCAAGFPVIKPEGERQIVEGSAEYNSLVDIITNIKTNTGVILPQGVTMEVISFEDTEAYDRVVNDQDKAIAKALLMPNMLGFSGENKFGSRNLGDTQLEAFLWMLDSEAQELEETLNEQLFKQLGELNFADEIAPTFRFSPLSDSQINKIITTWGELVGKGAVQRTDEDEAHVRTLLDFPEKGEVEEDGPTTVPTNQPNRGNDDKPNPVGDDETIIGNEQLTIVYTRAMRRVDFTAIDNSAQTIEFLGTQNLSETTAEAINAMAEAVKLLDLNDPSDANKVKFPKESIRAIKKNIKGTIQNAWKLGKNQGKQELQKALGKDRSKLDDPRLSFARLEDIAAKYFDVESFAIAGTLSEDIVKVFKQEILNGIKYSKSQDDVIKAIYEQLASKGLLSEEEVFKVLGEGLGVENPDHRLNTIVRNSTFSAINEARFSLFTDTSLGGFVEALQYSAILDIRVTKICRNLHDKIYPITSKFWDKYRPLNHHGCRSLLIPVTQRDTWEESEAPSIDPQQGFG